MTTRPTTLAAKNRELRRRLRAADSKMLAMLGARSAWERSQIYNEWKKLHDASRKGKKA